MPKARVLIVGAGFAGTVIAERLAARGISVHIVDRRSHIAGNAYDELDANGILVHRYGPHIFHTNSQEVITYLSRFTGWRGYEHRVLASVDGSLVPIPVNLTTLEMLFHVSLDAATAQELLAAQVEPRERVTTSEDVVVSRLGRFIYEKLYLNYTRKQWGRDPSQLDATVAGRLPVRFTRDDRYFTDDFQCTPAEGYTAMFTRMLRSPRIELALDTDFRDIDAARYEHVVFTGPVDTFFASKFGPLPYRSLHFEFEHVATSLVQPVATVNFPNEHAFTRVTEFKHITGQCSVGTTLCREFPREEGDPYYPVPAEESRALYGRYRAEALGIQDRVTFAGRLGTYQYYNMDQVIAQALRTATHVASVLGSTSRARPQHSDRGGHSMYHGTAGERTDGSRGVAHDGPATPATANTSG